MKLIILLVALSAAFGANSSNAQNAPVPGTATPQPQMPSPTNLQVLPKTVPPAALLSAMQHMSDGLGVQCNYCHVTEGASGRNDMASDEKPTKNVARMMLRMNADINRTLDTAFGKAANGQNRVNCGTCHRGHSKPQSGHP